MKARTEAEQFEKIAVSIHPSADAAVRGLAEEIVTLVNERATAGKQAVLGLATGSTPVRLYRELIRRHREAGQSFANVVTFNLDEYYGIAGDHRESYNRFMREQLFDHIDVPESQINIPDGTVAREGVFAFCRQYEEKIVAAGGLDIQVLGIGRTGHIGFNEPGSTRDSRTRLITLDRLTRYDAARDFMGEENVPRFAITMGVGTILDARKVVLMAWGANKAPIVARAVEGDISDQVPASFLQLHDNAEFLVDEAGASELTRLRRPWLTGQTNWSTPQARRAVCWLSDTLEKPVLKLIEEDYNENGMSDLLTEQGPAYQLNIRIFNELQHTITGWPGGKPNADDSSRPERAEPHPKRVVVFSPEPQDDVLCLGATLARLVDQGHTVDVVYQTSGNLGVPDGEAKKFAKVLLESAEIHGDSWAEQVRYAESILKMLADKGPFGEDPAEVRRLKGLIRRGEARAACQVAGLQPERVHFLDLPFYENGRYRQFQLTDADTAAVTRLLTALKPHQIYATGDDGDPSSLQFLAFETIRQALASLREERWTDDCYIWLYSGIESEYEPHQIDMAVPVSPAELAVKRKAIKQHQISHSQNDNAVHRNQVTAQRYDALGLSEYEAIETFRRYPVE